MKLKTKHSTIGHYAIMVVLFALAMEMKGFAQTYTFINSAAGTDAWNDTGNWDVNGVPVGSTSAAINLFSDISSPLGGNITVNSDPASLTLNSLTLNGLANASAATTVTLGTSGNVWTFGGATPAVTLGGMNNTGGSLTLTLQPNIALTQDLTIGGNGNAAFIFNGAISGARNLIKNGTSTLILNGANTYGSNTIVNGGTLIQNGGTLYSTNGSLNIGTTGANNLIIITNGGKAFFGAAGGIGGGTAANNNALVVQGADAFGNPSIVNMNGQRYNLNSAAYNVTNNSILVGPGGIITNSGFYIYFGTGGSITITNGGRYYGVGGAYIGRGPSAGGSGAPTNNVVFIGGIDSSTGQNAYWVNTGTIIIGGGPKAFGNGLVVGSDGIFNGSQQSFTIGTGNVNGGAKNNYLIVTNGGQASPANLYIGGGTGDTGNYIVVAGTNAAGARSTLTLAGTGRNMYIGNTTTATNSFATLGTGGLVTNLTGVILGGVNSTLYFDGGTLAPGANGNIISTNATANNPTTLVLAGGAIIDTGARITANQLPFLSGATPDGGLTKLGNGTLVLQGGVNTYNGPTTVSAGVLNIYGVITNTASIELSGGTLVVTNTAGNNLANRINDSATITMDGGAFRYDNDGSSGPFTEKAGPLVINSGTTNNVYVGRNSTLTFASLTCNATNSPQPTIDFQLADPATSKILFTTPPAIGAMPAWITLNGSSCYYDTIKGLYIPGSYIGVYGANLFTGGDIGEGLDLQGTNFAYAEYYGGYDPVLYAGAANSLLPVQNATFGYGANGSTVAGNDLSGQANLNGGNDPFATQPNFGTDQNDTNMAWICNTFIQANGYDLSFSVPTLNGQPYKLQLMFHEANITTVGTKVVAVNIGSQAVVPSMDLAALGACGTNSKGFVVSYLFTGNGNNLPVLLHGFSGVNAHAILNGMTLESLSNSIVKPHFFLSPANQTTIISGSITFTASAMGGINLPAYQWYDNMGSLMPGQTNASLSLTGVTTNNAGTYAVVASNSAGSATNTATLTVDATVSTSLAVVTGPYPGQGLNLTGNMVLAESYGTTNGANMVIGNALFVPSTRPGGKAVVSNLPYFGSTTMDYNLGILSESSVYWSSLNFSIPNLTAGVKYRLQLILHDNNYASSGSRVFNVSVGGNLVAQNVDLAALGAMTTNPKDIAIAYTFTSDGNPLAISMPASVNNAILCGLTLEDLSSPPSAPTVLQGVGNYTGVAGGSVQMSVAVAGGGMSYQWQQMVNGTYVNLSDAVGIAGSTSNTLTLSNLTLSEATNYNVVVWNTAGTTNSAGLLAVMMPSPNAMIGHWLSGNASYADTAGYAFPGTHDGFLVGSPANASWDADVPTNLPAFSGGYSLNLMNGGVALAISNTIAKDPNYAPTFDQVITNSFTVAVWVKGWPSSSYGAFVAKDGEQTAIGTNGFQLRRYSTGAQADLAVCSGTNTWDLTSANTIVANDNAWHHLVGTRNGTTGVRNLYIDSKLALSITNDFGPMGTSLLDRLCIGARQPDGGAFGNWSAVKLFDVQMYGYALTEDQIFAINGMPNSARFLTLPVSKSVLVGTTVQFAATVDGTQLTYQWNKIVGGVTNLLTDGGNVSGSTSNILTLASVGSGDVATYQIVVTNPGGSTNASAALTLATPLQPTLIQASVANNQLTLNWTNGVLQSTTNLVGGVWKFEAISNPPVTITLPGIESKKFYRVISQ